MCQLDTDISSSIIFFSPIANSRETKRKYGAWWVLGPILETSIKICSLLLVLLWFLVNMQYMIVISMIFETVHYKMAIFKFFVLVLMAFVGDLMQVVAASWRIIQAPKVRSLYCLVSMHVVLIWINSDALRIRDVSLYVSFWDACTLYSGMTCLLVVIFAKLSNVLRLW